MIKRHVEEPTLSAAPVDRADRPTSSVLMAAGTAHFGSFMHDHLTPLSLLAAKSGIGALLYLLCYRLLFPAEAREVWQLVKSIRGGASV